MIYSYIFTIISSTTFTFPYQICYEVVFSEDFIAYFLQIINFMVINGNKDNSILT